MVGVDVPADAPLRRPTAAVRRTLGWVQLILGALVVLAAFGVGSAVQERVDARETASIGASVETAGSGNHDHTVSGSDTVGDGAPAAVGTLIVGFTLTAAAGTIGRRRLDDREAARWDADWARVEPVWSGRVR